MPAGFGAGHLSMSPVCSSAPIPRGGGTAPRSAPCLGAHGTAALHSQELEAGFFPKTLGLFFFFSFSHAGRFGVQPGRGADLAAGKGRNDGITPQSRSV